MVGWVGRQLGKLNGFIPIAIGAQAREMKRHRAVLGAYADEVIARAKAADRADDVLGALMSARPSGKALTPTELRGHVLGLFLAGNETTAAALSWALVHGGQQPEAWAQVRNDPGRLHPSVPHRILAAEPCSLGDSPNSQASGGHTHG